MYTMDMKVELKMNMIKKIFKGLFALVIVILLVVLTYVIYMFATYYRIEDNQQLTIKQNSTKQMELDKEYRAMTFNIGYGAYSREFSFFLDSAVVAETKEKVSGYYGKGISKEDVQQNTMNSIEIMKTNPADFYLLQEVDVKADRSYKINQVEEIEQSFKKHDSVFASNFHSSFLALPLYDMHGKVESGLLTLSSVQTENALRISYPVTDDLFAKFTDLDRCFSVMRYPLENGKEFVLVNSHMSAYDEGGIIRQQQLKRLNQFLELEKEKGNYIVVGGDFNHDYCQSKALYPGNKEIAEWIAELSDKDLSTGYRFVIPKNRLETGTCRGSEEPYNKLTTYQSIVDGFIVSDNVEANAVIIDKEYLSSDHQAVYLQFKLKK